MKTTLELSQISIALDSLSTRDLSRMAVLLNQKIKSRSKSEIQESISSAKPTVGDPVKSMDLALSRILSEDWSSEFESYKNPDKSRDYYVYLHGRPESQKRKWKSLGVKTFAKPFYVGMGKGGRAHDFRRSSIHAKKLSDIMARGFSKEEVVNIVAHGLTEIEARELESKLIVFFGVMDGTDKHSVNRREAGLPKPTLLNLEYTQTPPCWDLVKY